VLDKMRNSDVTRVIVISFLANIFNRTSEGRDTPVRASSRRRARKSTN